jgi:hypothetical protein
VTDQAPAIDRSRLRSRRLRQVNFQGDALRLGMNWTEDDLREPQVLVESAYGMRHPGRFHFRVGHLVDLGGVDRLRAAVRGRGGRPRTQGRGPALAGQTSASWSDHPRRAPMTFAPNGRPYE